MDIRRTEIVSRFRSSSLATDLIAINNVVKLVPKFGQQFRSFLRIVESFLKIWTKLIIESKQSNVLSAIKSFH